MQRIASRGHIFWIPVRCILGLPHQILKVSQDPSELQQLAKPKPQPQQSLPFMVLKQAAP